MSSIRLVFPLVFALQIFVAVGLAGIIAYLSQMREARETATEILDLIGNGLDEQLFSFVSTPVSLTELLADEIRRHPEVRFDDLLSPKQIERLTRIIWVQSGLSRWVNLSLANAAGQSVRIDRKEYGKQMLKTSDIRSGGNVRWHLLDSRGQPNTPIEVQRISYDPRHEDYYLEATRRKQLILSPVHFSPLVRGAPVVTVAEPVYDARDRLRVVISSDIYLQGISSSLRGMRLPPYSAAFIFDRAGHLVASSKIETYDVNDADERPDRKLLGVLQSSEPLIRATGEHLRERLGSFAVSETLSFQYTSQKQHSYVYATRLFREFGLDWNLAVAIAEGGLIQNLLNGIRWTAGVSALLLALAIGIGLITAAWMIRPILTLRAVASALEHDQLDDRHLQVRQLEKDTRRRDEFGRLAETFMTMIKEVRTRHALLESQLEQLRVGIDADDARKQAMQITATEFFQDLKRKARQLRQRPERAGVESAAASCIELEP